MWNTLVSTPSGKSIRNVDLLNEKLKRMTSSIYFFHFKQTRDTGIYLREGNLDILGMYTRWQTRGCFPEIYFVLESKKYFP